DRKRPLGSVPAHTTLQPFIFSVGLMARLITRLCVMPAPAGSHVPPPSSLIKSPSSNVPPYSRPGLSGSAAIHNRTFGAGLSAITHPPSPSFISYSELPADKYKVFILSSSFRMFLILFHTDSLYRVVKNSSVA